MRPWSADLPEAVQPLGRVGGSGVPEVLGQARGQGVVAGPELRVIDIELPEPGIALAVGGPERRDAGIVLVHQVHRRRGVWSNAAAHQREHPGVQLFALLLGEQEVLLRPVLRVLA